MAARIPLLLFLVAVLVGCMAVGRPIDRDPLASADRPARNAKGRSRGSSGDADAADAKSDHPAIARDASKDEVRGDNPFRRRESRSPREKESSEETASGGSRESRSSDSTRSSAELAPRRDRSAMLDPVTRDMLEAELRESSPSEREELERDIAGLDPDVVRLIVKLHRMARSSKRLEQGRTAADHSFDRSRSSERWPNDDRDRGVIGAGYSREEHAGAPRDGRVLNSDDDRRARLDAAPPSELTLRDRATGSPSSIPDWPYPETGRAIPEQWPPRSAPELYRPPSALPVPRGVPNDPTSGTISRDDRYPHAPPPNVPPSERTLADGRRFAATGESPYRSGEAALRTPPDVRHAGWDVAPSSESGVRTAAGIAGDLRSDGRVFDSRPAAAPPSTLETSAAPRGTFGHTSDDLQRLIAAAEADAGSLRVTQTSNDSDRRLYIERHVYLRMLYLMAGQQERALQAIPGIDAADQEFWQQMFWGVANYFDGQTMPNRSDRASQTAAQLRTAIHRLQETARLELRNVAFCHEITSYGAYQRFPRDEFSRGQPVLVYAEVANFKSVPAADGQYLTRLRSTVEIYTPAGGLVDRIVFAEQEDVCRNQRRDYFQSHQFTIPASDKIQLGPHILKVIVEDLLSQKVAEYTVNFTVK